MTPGSRKLHVTLLIALCIGLIFVASVNRAFAVTEADARDAVEAAQSTFVSDYHAVADAEKAGANISGLLITLNEAADLLSRADLALAEHDNDTAFANASKARQVLSGLADEALILKENAAQKSYSDFLIFVVGSVVGTVIVVFASFVLWRVLKRGYVENGGGKNGSS